MVFEAAGRLRYHALWAYTALTAIFVGLDKVPIDDINAVITLLAPIALVITADIIKNRNKISGDPSV